MFSDNSGRSGYRLLAAIVLSTILILVDQRSPWGDTVRYPVSFVTGPIHYLANLPGNLLAGIRSQARSRSELLEENERLDRQLLVLEQRSQRLAVLEAENVRLRELLNSSANLDARVLVAEIIGIEADPNRHELILNKGTDAGLFKGQAVLDAHGLIGQVVEVGAVSSRVLLITDAMHALSVKVNRSGVRSILAGTGHPDRLSLLYVPDSADIAEGDLLVSTGLGRRYPAGYPVATVVSINHEPGQPFMTVEARPAAWIDRASHVLLVAGAPQSVAPAPQGGIDGP
ncbi:rod shape-determining protein MreC [Alcanivorax sp. 1008]|nr:rod shape-determining protein MreC [Alcanivorax sp. 1008]